MNLTNLVKIKVINSITNVIMFNFVVGIEQ